MRVTTPRGWLVLVGLFSLVTAGVLWGVFGSISVTLSGQGILLRAGGVLPIQPIADGVIEQIFVAPGAQVRRGEVVARVSRNDLVSQIKEIGIRLKELEENKAESRGYRDRENELQRVYLTQEEANTTASIRSDREQLVFLEGKVKGLERMQRAGGASRQQLTDAFNQRDSLQQKIAASQNGLKEIQRKRAEISRTERDEDASAVTAIDETRRSLGMLEQQFKLESEVTSPIDGRIIELLASEGTVVAAGTSIMSLESLGGNETALEAVIYVSSEGSNLKPDMEAHVSPAGVQKEEFGFIRGSIARVSDFPSTPQGMMRVLGNESLVQSLVAMGPVIEVTVALSPSPEKSGGYRWSSPKGSSLRIRSGTIRAAKSKDCFADGSRRMRRGLPGNGAGVFRTIHPA